MAEPLDPEVALVLLWHWTQTSSPEVPQWAKDHPAWPDGVRRRKARLVEAARPLVETMEQRVLLAALEKLVRRPDRG